MIKNYIVLIILIIFGFSQCVSTKEGSAKGGIDMLKELMTGSFSSEKQAKKDSTYYNITLKMYPIWEDRKEEHWLYVEQAVATAQNRPYRQRVYKIERAGENVFRSIVYTLPNPKRFVGKWSTPEAFNAITPDSLTLRDDCAVYMKRMARKYFKGETKIGSCKSSLRGATYATSQVEVFKNKIVSWDRGFDNDDEQVWGAEKGGYIFDKLD